MPDDGQDAAGEPASFDPLHPTLWHEAVERLLSAAERWLAGEVEPQHQDALEAELMHRAAVVAAGRSR